MDRNLIRKIRGLHRIRKTAVWMKYAAAFLLTAILVLGLISNSYSENINRELSENMIRLHVIANSDSLEDQQLKRDVRDAVLVLMQQKLQGVREVAEANDILQGALAEITDAAQKVIAAQGWQYPVKAMLGDYPFPTKAYGDIMLPAGEYQALRIVIGRGQGANWWCVLFPPLCFVDVTHGAVPDSVKETLKQSLSEEEYKIITSSDQDADIPVRIRFKIIEVLQDSRIRVAGALSKLLKGSG